MNYIDSHTHLFEERLSSQINTIIDRALAAGVEKMILPNVDSQTIEDMLTICQQFPKICFPAIGLHPTSVKENYKEELNNIEKAINENISAYKAIGEVGIDLYWDKTFLVQQIEVFRWHIQMAKNKNLPLIIHGRNSYPEIFETLSTEGTENLRGVFHCFSGDVSQAHDAVKIGFKLGIGGVVTYKKSGLDEIVKEVGLENIILETDSPWLPPVPKRGETNEPSFIPFIAKKISEILNTNLESVAAITTKNAEELFAI